jgi:hypothetical protein
MSDNAPRTAAGRALLSKARTVDGWHTNFDAGDILAIEAEAAAPVSETKRDLTLKDFIGSLRWITEYDGRFPVAGGHREKDLIKLWEKRLRLPAPPAGQPCPVHEYGATCTCMPEAAEPGLKPHFCVSCEGQHDEMKHSLATPPAADD